MPTYAEPTTPSKKSAGRELLVLAVPLMISFWFRSAFQWVDAFYAAHLGEVADASIAAIGLTLPFDLLMIAFWVGTSNGLTSRLAAAMGAGEGAKIEQLKRAAVRVIKWLCVFFFVVAAGCYFLADRVGLEPLTARQFQIYATIVLAGSGITSFWSILPDSIVKAHQDTRSTMWAGLISSLLNVLFNTIFVFGLGAGIAGIALSTVLGRVGGLIFATYRARRHEVLRIEKGQDVDPSTFVAPIREVLTIAIPAAMAYTLMALESLAVNGLLANGPNPTETLAAWAIFDRSARFLAMPLIAIGVAILPFAARLYGRKDVESIIQALKYVLYAAFGFVALVVTPICWIAGPWLATALFEAPLTAGYAELGMVFVPAAVLVLGPMIILRSTFEGMQRPRPGLLIALVRSVLLTVPLVALGMTLAIRSGHTPILGAFLGSISASLISSIFSGFLARRVFADVRHRFSET